MAFNDITYDTYERDKMSDRCLDPVACVRLSSLKPKLWPEDKLTATPTGLTVFEIAWWTSARDQHKQPRSSKTTVFAGPKDQQLVLYFRSSHSSVYT